MGGKKMFRKEPDGGMVLAVANPETTNGTKGTISGGEGVVDVSKEGNCVCRGNKGTVKRGTGIQNNTCLTQPNKDLGPENTSALPGPGNRKNALGKEQGDANTQ